MKILYLVADGSLGGGTTHVSQLLEQFRHTYEVGLITQQHSYLASRSREWKIWTAEADFFSSRLNASLIANIKQFIHRFQPNFIHVHGGRAAFSLAWLRVNVPIIYTIHGLHFAHKNNSLARTLGRWAEQWSIHHVQQVVFVSRYDRDLARSLKILPQGVSSQIIYNGIPIANAVESPRPAFKVPHWDIGFVGRLETVKDPLLFVEIMKGAPDLRGVILGGGSLFGVVQETIARYGLADRLTLLGACDHSQVMELLPEIGALVMTSHWEALGLALIEAMALGVPVVAPDVGGIPEVVLDGETGILVRSRQPKAFLEELKRLRADPALRKRLIAQGQQWVRQNFSETHMFSKLQHVYDRCLNYSLSVDIRETQ